MKQPKSCVTPIITDNMITLGSYATYKNKREFSRKLRLVMNDLKASVPAEYVDQAVWCNNKPIARAHDPYARIGWISVKVRIPKELI